MACYICGTTEKELRPYGKDGQDLCFPCLKSDPGIEAEAGRQFSGKLKQAEFQSPEGIAAIGVGEPIPFASSTGEN